ncbi:hypothetical protein [Rubripirellula reticaptiva]|nr:hypothetical protein [Rubripirellula reticaptiva]
MFLTRGMADKMQIAKKAKLIAVLAAACCQPTTMIHTGWAVEVSGSVTQQNSQLVDENSASQAPSHDSFVLGSRTFTIPYTVDSSGPATVEVQLFVSRGPSDPWKLIESKRPTEADARQFEFTADQDGEFWFATRTTNQSSMTQLASTVSPQLKVFVDTSKPYCEVLAEADGDGRIDIQLVIQDATPLKSMQLRYVTESVRTWQDVDITGLPTDGRMSFKPNEDWQQLSLQLIVTDGAGNQNAANKLVLLPRIAEAPPENRYAMRPGGGIDARQTPFRLSESDVTDAQTASGPVIALDRHQRALNQRNQSQQNQQHATAHGYAPAVALPNQRNFGNFRGAAFPASPQDQVSQGFGTLPSQTAPELIPPPEPASMTDGLFNFPAPKQQAGIESLPTPHATAVPFDAPSIYALPAPKQSQSALPPPASLEQISNGLGLTSPTNPSAPESIPAPAGQADALKTKTPSVTPESIPAPLPERTLSEALRPMSEKSALPPRRVDTPAPKPSLAPKTTDYRSARPNSLQSRTPESPTTSAKSLASRVPVRYSDGLRFSLAYELEAVGSQGVEAIELYGSVDEGRSWKLWGSDPDRTSPFDIETREEGVFGYRIVVVGNNGLASPRPLPGESPDIVVVVDKQAPEVRITGARYGEGDRIGALVILYECSDPNLMARPVALSFGPSIDGPWTTIAAGLANDGDYVWPADPQLPRQFYLRLDATDQAGNVGTYILDKPIDAQGLAPRARIRGFQSISGVEPDASFK